MRTISFFLSMILLTGCCPHQFAPNPEPDPLPPFYVPERIRVAVVLGSGGVRGMAHVGVLEELERAGIPIDLIVGCSAGSIVGAFYADNPCAREVRDGVCRVKTNALLDLDLWNCRYGLCQGRSMKKVLCHYLSTNRFEDLKIPLVIVASDLYTGEMVPFASGNLIKAVIASSSIPFVYVPCEHMGRVLVDGGIINPVPVKVAKDLGAEVIIAVDLCELLPNTFPTNLFSVATRSCEIAFMWQNEACTHHADVIIRPKTCGVGVFNDAKKQIIYDAGRRAAREQMPCILAALKEFPPLQPEDCKWKLVHLDAYTPRIAMEEAEEEEKIAEEEAVQQDNLFNMYLQPYYQ